MGIGKGTDLQEIDEAARTSRRPGDLRPGRDYPPLACAIVNDPSLLPVDEPFSVLDMPTAETLRTDLLDLWCKRRMPIQSILVVTHNI